MASKTIHKLPINDINHAWSETRRRLEEIEPGVVQIGEPMEVFVGVCTCGWRTEALDARGVTLTWLEHVHVQEELEKEDLERV